MDRDIDRREFLTTAGAAAAGGVLGGLGLFDTIADAAPAAGGMVDQSPNIVFVLIDELRFPTHFPHGITTVDQFLQRFMPNLHQLWQHGVKFDHYYTAGMACSPSRAALHTGLYPHQQWLLGTRISKSPSLRSPFPTYGKLIRSFGYETPYFGKWHLSNEPKDGQGYLEDYGFSGKTTPDPTGTNGQGRADDPHIAAQAVSWLESHSRDERPFCLTVSLVNPHDTQYFWAGTEGDTFEGLFTGKSLIPKVNNFKTVPGEDDPPSYGYPAAPSNWESAAQLEKNKPSSQLMYRTFQETVWGAASDDPSVTGFSLQASPLEPHRLGMGVAPHSYWRRGMDVYTYVMTLVDKEIGKVIAAIPRNKLRNTVIVFASDHGEHNGSHGFLSGKMGTFYEEAWRVPLIVVDPTGRFAHQSGALRSQLVSSVDLLPLLVTIGNRGSWEWMRGDLHKIYGERLDLLSILRNPEAPGRSHVLFASDELYPLAMNYLHAPTHLLGVRTQDAKLGTYSRWHAGTTVPMLANMELEYYDYSTAGGRAETESTPHDPRARALLARLLREYVPQQMQAPLPASLQKQEQIARRSYLVFRHVNDLINIAQLIQFGFQQAGMGYGFNF